MFYFSSFPTKLKHIADSPELKPFLFYYIVTISHNVKGEFCPINDTLKADSGEVSEDFLLLLSNWGFNPLT